MFAYSLVSTAISEDRTKLRQGVRLLAEIAHTHGIPVTWAINRASARALATDLTQWHEDYGDELLLIVDIGPVWGSDTPVDGPLSAEHIVTMREKLPDFISTEWDRVQREMEWASPVVAGRWRNTMSCYMLWVKLVSKDYGAIAGKRNAGMAVAHLDFFILR